MVNGCEGHVIFQDIEHEPQKYPFLILNIAFLSNRH